MALSPHFLCFLLQCPSVQAGGASIIWKNQWSEIHFRTDGYNVIPLHRVRSLRDLCRIERMSRLVASTLYMNGDPRGARSGIKRQRADAPCFIAVADSSLLHSAPVGLPSRVLHRETTASAPPRSPLSGKLAALMVQRGNH